MNTIIKELMHEGTFKYLSVQEAEGVTNTTNKEKLEENSIVKSEVYCKLSLMLENRS